MHIHILGICGTFMANVAILARALGHEISGSDAGVYPPMSTMLMDNGIPIISGYQAEAWSGRQPDLVLVGNALSRGNPSLEYTLANDLPFTSGAQWLAENVLRGRRVLAVAGTHGKTTTTAMLAWILQREGLEPGYLIGGMASNFPAPAALGNAPFFVIEADEYDTAFSDKRSKFIHYRPEVLICNTLEFDHADIFSSLEDIQIQFHNLIRTMSGKACIISSKANKGIQQVLTMGCWSKLCYTGAGSAWQLRSEAPSWRSFEVLSGGRPVARVEWQTIGRHNAENALAAVVAANEIGIDPAVSCQALASYQPVARRLEPIYQGNGISIFSDFAHHPTAIKATMSALRGAFPGKRLIAVLEPASYTMRIGHHGTATAEAMAAADLAFIYHPAAPASASQPLPGQQQKPPTRHQDINALHDELLHTMTDGDIVVLMGNSSFGGLPQRLPQSLALATPLVQ